ncbi:MAG: squalene/phytoene synthase family protein [Ignavibacteria bacterium]|nr:squalene/phytoene synthase family protein [Ignavibacteria bacterium]
MTLDDAYSHCLSIARSHYENFPVASFLLPRELRKHVAAVYAIARMGDDIADEHGDKNVDERMAALDFLDSIVDGTDPRDEPVFVAVQHTIKTCRLSPSLFHRLFEAFRRDAAGGKNVAYGTWDAVLEYCRYSANPVGEIILSLSGSATPQAIDYSNDVCTALQITNFLQDREVDMSRGRNYVPLTVEETIYRTRLLFKRGRQVVRCVPSLRLKMELKAIIAGGETMLDKIEHQSQRLSGNRRVTLTSRDFPSLLLRLLNPL